MISHKTDNNTPFNETRTQEAREMDRHLEDHPITSEELAEEVWEDEAPTAAATEEVAHELRDAGADEPNGG